MKRIYSFRESSLFSRILKDIKETFEIFGYRYIRLPSFNRESVRKSFIPVLNTREGEVIYLRDDFTNQIIKHLYTIGEVDFPLKIYYEGNLFLPELDEFETYQVGIELLGSEGYIGDFEIILCIYNVLVRIGFERSKLILGIPAIIDSIAEKLKVDNKIIEELIKEKNLSKIRQTFGRNSIVEKIIFLQGKKEVLEHTVNEIPFIEDMLYDLNLLTNKLEELTKIEYIIDFSYVRKLPYYNGITFEFILENLGFPVASGGRYDGIYYKNIPATGGAIYVDNIIPALKNDVNGGNKYIIHFKDFSKDLIKLIDLFMNKSLNFSLISSKSVEYLVDYALKNDFKYIIDFENLKFYNLKKKKWVKFESFNQLFNFFNVA